MKINTVEEFRENFSGAPYDFEEFAIYASGIKNCETLRIAAMEFLEAKDKFEHELELEDIEIG